MTYRLTVIDKGGKSLVKEYDDFAAIMASMMELIPWQDTPRAVTIHQLKPFQETVWSEVVAGDEVAAPDGSFWTVENASSVDSGLRNYTIVNVHDGREVTTTPRPDAPVQRRPGLHAAVVDLLKDVLGAVRIID